MLKKLIVLVSLTTLFSCAPFHVYQKPNLPDSELSKIQIENFSSLNTGFWTFINNIECSGATIREIRGNMGYHGITKGEVVNLYSELNKPFSIYIEFTTPLSSGLSWKEYRKILTFSAKKKLYKINLISNGDSSAGFSLYEVENGKLNEVSDGSYVVRDWVKGLDPDHPWCTKITDKELLKLK